jgi:peroxiredoxin
LIVQASMIGKNWLRCCFIVLLQLFILSQHCLAAKITLLEEVDPPDTAFFTENGEKIFLEKFEGKVVLLSFWATWCASCTKEIPELDVLQKDFRKLDFEVVAVSEDFQGVNAAQGYFKKQEIRHLKIYHDYGNALFNALAVAGLPTSFLINADGKIVASFKGAVNWHDDEVRNIILTHIPNNPTRPKNSYKEQSLNQKVKLLKDENTPEEAANVNMDDNKQEDKK